MNIADQRRAVAEQEFSSYHFSVPSDEDGWTVKDARGWEFEGPERLIREVFFENDFEPGDDGDYPAFLGQFTVDFLPGSDIVVSAYGTLDGEEIGRRAEEGRFPERKLFKVKFRPHDWLDVETLTQKYGIQAKVADNRPWQHCCEGSIPLVFDVAKDRDTKLEKLRSGTV